MAKHRAPDTGQMKSPAAVLLVTYTHNPEKEEDDAQHTEEGGQGVGHLGTE